MGFTEENYKQVLLFFRDKDKDLYKILMKHRYLCPPPARNLFANLIGVIIGQKIRFQMARKQRGLLYTQLGTDNFTIDDLLNRGILHLQEQEHMSYEINIDNIINYGLLFLRDIGIDETRCQTIQTVVDYLKTNDIDLINFNQLDDLKTLKGIGNWTINCVKLMHTLNSTESDQFTTFYDHLLHEDLIIRRGIQKLYGITDLPSINNLSKSWEPWRGIVTWYLWKEFT